MGNRADTTLESEVAALRAQFIALSERVRLTATAERFLAGEHPIRVGDYFLLYEDFPTRLSNVSSEGKWTYFDGHHSVEPFRIPRPGDHERLYTIAEVAEIVARAISEAQK